MSITTTKFLRKCLVRGTAWSCTQTFMMAGFFALAIPYFSILLFFYMGWVILVSAFAAGITTSLAVFAVYRLFYTVATTKTRLLATTTAIVMCSSIFFIVLSFIARRNSIYNFYGKVDWGILISILIVWAYIILSTLVLSLRLGKFVEQFFQSNNNSTIASFRSAPVKEIVKYIKNNYLSLDRSVLDSRLVTLGYNSDAIETAWQIFLASAPHSPKLTTKFLVNYFVINFSILGAVLLWAVDRISNR